MRLFARFLVWLERESVHAERMRCMEICHARMNAHYAEQERRLDRKNPDASSEQARDACIRRFEAWACADKIARG